MIKTYLKPYGTRTEAKRINTETGEIMIYMINNDAEITGIRFPFSFYQTTAEKWGYKSPAEMIAELKRRKQLGEEVQTDKQKADEISALLQLAKFRSKKELHIYDIEDKLINIYGLSEEYTGKILRYITQYDLERHIIRVFTENGDEFTTEINGTPEEIASHYNEKIEFIA